MKYYIDAFTLKYADFTGRAPRTEFWMFVLCNFVVSIVISLVGWMLLPGSAHTLLGVLYSLASFIPSLALSVRRLHDSDRSGWWLFLILIPIIGFIVIFIFTVLDSTPGNNSYGPNPKGMMGSVAVTPPAVPMV